MLGAPGPVPQMPAALPGQPLQAGVPHGAAGAVHLQVPGSVHHVPAALLAQLSATAALGGNRAGAPAVPGGLPLPGALLPSGQQVLAAGATGQQQQQQPTASSTTATLAEGAGDATTAAASGSGLRAASSPAVFDRSRAPHVAMGFPSLPPPEEPTARCGHCGVLTKMEALRLRGKGPGVEMLRCKNCERVYQRMYRATGSTVLPSGMSEEAMQSFMREAATQSQEQIRVRVTQLSESFHEVESTWAESGEWLPLSVWAQRGFIPADIQRDATESDIKRNVPMLGDCYRIRIFSTGQAGRKGDRNVTRDELGGKSSSSRMKLGIKRARRELKEEAAAAAGEEPPEEPDDDESSSSEDIGADRQVARKGEATKTTGGKNKPLLSKKEQKKAAKEKLAKEERKRQEREAEREKSKQEAVQKLAATLAPKMLPLTTLSMQAMDTLLCKAYIAMFSGRSD